MHVLKRKCLPIPYNSWYGSAALSHTKIQLELPFSIRSDLSEIAER